MIKNQTTSPSEAGAVPPIPKPTNGVIDSATLDLLATWRREDVTENPEEVRAAEREVAEFKRAMNENRAGSGEPPVYP